MPLDPSKREGLQKIDQDFLRNIEEYKWHVMSVAPRVEEEGDIWSYSTGLFYHFKHPEIIVVGERIELMYRMINAIGDRVQAGEKFRPEEGYADIIADYDCQFRTVHVSQYWSYVNFACWFYDNDETSFPLLQCFFPDMQGRFPWEEGCEEWAIEAQPLLYKRAVNGRETRGC